MCFRGREFIHFRGTSGGRRAAATFLPRRPRLRLSGGGASGSNRPFSRLFLLVFSAFFFRAGQVSSLFLAFAFGIRTGFGAHGRAGGRGRGRRSGTLRITSCR